MLIDTSKIGINQKPPIKDIGIPNETQNASFGLRKIARMITTRSSPKYAFFVKRSILPLRMIASSFHVLIPTPIGRVDDICST